jgi:hypothetical protein
MSVPSVFLDQYPSRETRGKFSYLLIDASIWMHLLINGSVGTQKK